MKSFHLFIGADHAGHALKEGLKRALVARGHRVDDLSPTLIPGDDYPPIATALAKRVAAEPTARGLLVCGSGDGVAIAANRMKGIRAIHGFTPEQTKEARADEDVNILTLSGRHQTTTVAMRLIEAFLNTPASRAVRHRRRIQELG